MQAMLTSLGYEVDGSYVQEVLSIFGKFDADNSGFIEPGEFEQLAAHLGLDEAVAAADTQAAAEPASPAAHVSAPIGSPAFQRFDANGDGAAGWPA